MSDNKPCPICGGCGILESHQGRRKNGYFVACGMDGCHTEGPVRDSADAAWKIWNRRDDSALSQARAEGRREGLEEAAKAAERVTEPGPCDSEMWRGYTDGRKEAASIIRALAQKEPVK